jgi:hypothetical protein
MNKISKLNLVGFCMFLLVTTTGFADEEALPEIAPVDETPLPELQAEVPYAATPAPGDVTTTDAEGTPFTIVLDCGDCKPSDHILELIKAIYLGNKSAKAKPLTYTITAYRSRSAGARIAFGAMAGKDLIQGIATYQGGTKEVGDSAITILCGTDCVATNVGEELAGIQK